MKTKLLFFINFILIKTCFTQVNNQYDLKSFNTWYLSSIPAKQLNLFLESQLQNDLKIGFNRAKICWYSIDPLFLRNNSQTPDHIKNDHAQQANHFVREIYVNEIYTNYQNPDGVPTISSVLNLAYYPNEKGPNNYDIDSTFYSNGIDSIGKLNSPERRWGGIMKNIQKGIFTNRNLNYLGFWLMDPFVYNTNASGGNLFINIGNISEDILKDNRKSYENGLPTTSVVTDVDTTAWGRVSQLNIANFLFSNDVSTRQHQDIGLDGLNNEDEQSFFQNYLNSIASKYGQSAKAYINAYIDPSTDDYHYFRGSDYDNWQTSILCRYKKYCNVDGNTILSSESYPTMASIMPDSEDKNRNGILDTIENYYQFQIVLSPESLHVGQNFITDKITVTPANGDSVPVTWYKFLIPLNSSQREIIGNINSLDSSDCVRLVLNSFSDSIICRFFQLAFVTNDLSIINEIPINSNILIYPNPSINKLNIEQSKDEIKSIKIYDLSGRILLNKDEMHNIFKYTLDISNLSNGIYIIEVESKNNIISKKILIEK